MTLFHSWTTLALLAVALLNLGGCADRESSPANAKAGENEKVAKQPPSRDSNKLVRPPLQPKVEAQRPTVADLMAKAKSGEMAERRLAVCTLGSTPQAKKAVPVLIELLKEDDAELYSGVCFALGQMGVGAGEAVPALIVAANERDADSRKSGFKEGSSRDALEVLQRIPKAPRSVAPALVELLKDDEPRVRLQAARYLCALEIADKECIAVLAELAKRRDASIRQEALNLLARYGSAAKDAVPVLVALLDEDNSDFSTKAAAASILGGVGPDAKVAIPALKRAQKYNCQWALKTGQSWALENRPS